MAVDELGMTSEKTDQVVVIVVPFPAQSHLNQLLQFSCLISSSYPNNNIQVHYTCSSIHVKQAKLRFSNKELLHKANIHFHELPTPPFLSPPPNPNATTKFPAHLQPSWTAALHLRQPIAQLLHELSPKVRRVIVIHDVLMSYMVQDTVTIPNAASFGFMPVSAFSFLFTGHENKAGAPKGLPFRTGNMSLEFQQFLALQLDYFKQMSGMVLNSSRAIEGTYIDLLAKENGSKIWAIGPVIHGKSSNIQHHPCLEWLSKQAPESVIYVSFGTTTSLTNEQIKEIAEGLEKSQQKFIWVFRDADKGDIFIDDSGGRNAGGLPEGFEQRVEESGMVVRDWAPQLEILAHPSTGGFMSHCGWNSCLEAITLGVPIAAWPMHSDQPMNAFLVCEIWKAGLQVNEREYMEDKVINSSAIAEAISRLMATDEGDELRKRAEELGSVLRQGVEEGGASLAELSSFISHITS